MSKELEALEKLTNYGCSSMSEKIECAAVIETALNRLEEQDEVLKFIKDHILLDGSVLKANFQWDLDIEENGDLLKEYLK